jgi:hypothetical protein
MGTIVLRPPLPPQGAKKVYAVSQEEGVMEMAIKIAWLLLALVHASPAAVLFRPSLLQTLYGVPADGATSLLLTHRGATFLAIVAAAVWAAFDPSARRLCTVILAVSVLGYLILYARAGMPGGPLRTVAAVDAFALAPLALVMWSAWRPAS